MDNKKISLPSKVALVVIIAVACLGFSIQNPSVYVQFNKIAELRSQYIKTPTIARIVEDAGGNVVITQTPGQARTGGATVTNTRTGERRSTRNESETIEVVTEQQNLNSGVPAPNPEDELPVQEPEYQPIPGGNSCTGGNNQVVIADGQNAYSGAVDASGNALCYQCQNGNWVDQGICRTLHESGAPVVAPPTGTAEGTVEGRRNNCYDTEGTDYVIVGDGSTRADGQRCMDGVWVAPNLYSAPSYATRTASEFTEAIQESSAAPLPGRSRSACSTSYTSNGQTVSIVIPDGESAAGGAASFTETGESTTIKICKNGLFVPCNSANRSETNVTDCQSPTVLPQYATQNDQSRATCSFSGGYQLPAGRATNNEVCKDGTMTTIPIQVNEVGSYLLGQNTSDDVKNRLRALCQLYAIDCSTDSSLLTFSTSWLTKADPSLATQVTSQMRVVNLYDVSLGKGAQDFKNTLLPGCHTSLGHTCSDGEVAEYALSLLRTQDNSAYQQVIKIKAEIAENQKRAAYLTQYLTNPDDESAKSQVAALCQLIRGDCMRLDLFTESQLSTIDPSGEILKSISKARNDQLLAERLFNVGTGQANTQEANVSRNECLNEQRLVLDKVGLNLYNCTSDQGLSQYAEYKALGVNPLLATQIKTINNASQNMIARFKSCQSQCTSLTKECVLDQTGTPVCVNLNTVRNRDLSQTYNVSLGQRINAHTKATQSCGASGEVCCYDRAGGTTLMKNTRDADSRIACTQGFTCQGGDAVDPGKCTYDTDLARAQATTAFLKSQAAGGNLDSRDIASIISLNNAVSPTSGDALSQASQSLCSGCRDGEYCLYSDKSKSFRCANTQSTDVTASYLSLLSRLPEADSNTARGGLDQPCSGRSWFGLGKGSCDNAYLTCGDNNTCEIAEGVRPLLTATSLSLSDETLALNITSFVPQGLALSTNVDLAQYGCNSSNSTYQANGACWICWDATARSIQRAPDYSYCSNSALANTLPGKKCSAGGGYCAGSDTIAANGVTNGGKSDCPGSMSCFSYTPTTTGVVRRGPGESCNEAGRDSRCANGLECLRGVCVSQIGAAFDAEYQQGELAYAIRNNKVINAIPLVNFIVDHAVAPIVTSIGFGSGYYRAPAIQAEVAEGVVRSAKADPTIAATLPDTFSTAILDTISGNAKVRYTTNTLDRINEGSEQNVEASTTYKVLAGLSYFTGAWSERFVYPSGPRYGVDIPEGPPVDNAFYGYASTFANSQSTELEKLGASANFGGEVAMTVTDFLTLGAESAFTKGASIADRAIVRSAASQSDNVIARGFSYTLSRPKVWGEAAELAIRQSAGGVIERTGLRSAGNIVSQGLVRGTSEIVKGLGLDKISNTYALKWVGTGVQTISESIGFGLTRNERLVRDILTEDKTVVKSAEELVEFLDTRTADNLFDTAMRHGYSGTVEQFENDVLPLYHRAVVKNIPQNLVESTIFTSRISPEIVDRLPRIRAIAILDLDAQAKAVLTMSQEIASSTGSSVADTARELTGLITAFKYADEWGITVDRDNLESFIRTIGDITDNFSKGPLSSETITTLAHNNNLNDSLTRQLIDSLEISNSPFILPVTKRIALTNGRLSITSDQTITSSQLTRRLQSVGVPTSRAKNLADTILYNNPTLARGAQNPAAINTTITHHSFDELDRAATAGTLHTQSASDDVVQRVEAGWSVESKGKSSGTAYRIDTSALPDDPVKKQAESFNALLDSFEMTKGYHLYPEQVETLLKPDAIAQLKKADGTSLAGKTDVVMTFLSARDPRSLSLFKAPGEAVDFVNLQMLSDSGKTFYGGRRTRGVYIDNQRGFIEIDFAASSFNPSSGRIMSAGEVSKLLNDSKLHPESLTLTFVGARPDVTWTRLGGNPNPRMSFLDNLLGRDGTTAQGQVMKDMTSGNYGSFLVLSDEIGDDIAGNFALSGKGLELGKIKSSAQLGGLPSGSNAIAVYQDVVATKSFQELRAQRLQELKGESITNPLRALDNGQFIPDSPRVHADSLAEIIEGSLRRHTGNGQTENELRALISRLRDTKISQAEQAIAETEIVLTRLSSISNVGDESLINDLRFRKVSLQESWNQLGRVPGTDFGQEGSELVLRKARSTTGERLSSAPQLLAFYSQGPEMLDAYKRNLLENSEAVRRYNLADIQIFDNHSQMSVAEFYQELARGGNTIRGFDATPETAAHILSLNTPSVRTLPPPTNLAVDTTRDEAAKRLATTRASSFSTQATALGLPKSNRDMALDIQSIAKEAHDAGVGYQKIIVAQYAQKPTGEEIEEYIEYTVKDGAIDFSSRRNLGDAVTWNNRIQDILSGIDAAVQPQDLMIAYMGRERAVDLKVTANHTKIRWNYFVDSESRDLVTAEQIEQLIRRNRLVADPNNVSKLADPRDLATASQFDLYLISNRTDLTASNVMDDFFVANQYQYLSNLRLENLMKNLGSAPKTALDNLDSVAVALHLSASDTRRLMSLRKELQGSAGSFKSMMDSSVSRTPLQGEKLYEEVFSRAAATDTQLRAMVKRIETELNLTDTQLKELRRAFHVADTFPNQDVFLAELRKTTTNFTQPASFGPADQLMAYAANNSTDDAVDPAFRAAKEKYLARGSESSTTPRIAAPTSPTSPSSPTLSQRIGDFFGNIRNRFVASPTSLPTNITTNAVRTARQAVTSLTTLPTARLTATVGTNVRSQIANLLNQPEQNKQVSVTPSQSEEFQSEFGRIITGLQRQDIAGQEWTFKDIPQVTPTEDDFVYLYRGVNSFDPSVLQASVALRSSPSSMVPKITEEITKNSNLPWHYLWNLHRDNIIGNPDREDVFISMTRSKEAAALYPLFTPGMPDRYIITIKVPRDEYNKLYIPTRTEELNKEAEDEVMALGYIKSEWIVQVENKEDGSIVYENSNITNSNDSSTTPLASTDTRTGWQRFWQTVVDNTKKMLRSNSGQLGIPNFRALLQPVPEEEIVANLTQTHTNPNIEISARDAATFTQFATPGRISQIVSSRIVSNPELSKRYATEEERNRLATLILHSIYDSQHPAVTVQDSARLEPDYKFAVNYDTFPVVDINKSPSGQFPYFQIKGLNQPHQFSLDGEQFIIQPSLFSQGRNVENLAKVNGIRIDITPTELKPGDVITFPTANGDVSYRYDGVTETTHGGNTFPAPILSLTTGLPSDAKVTSSQTKKIDIADNLATNRSGRLQADYRKGVSRITIGGHPKHIVYHPGLRSLEASQATIYREYSSADNTFKRYFITGTGVELNGVLVTSPTEIKNGDVITVKNGSDYITFRFDGEESVVVTPRESGLLKLGGNENPNTYVLPILTQLDSSPIPDNSSPSLSSPIFAPLVAAGQSFADYVLAPLLFDPFARFEIIHAPHTINLARQVVKEKIQNFRINRWKSRVRTVVLSDEQKNEIINRLDAKEIQLLTSHPPLSDVWPHTRNISDEEKVETIVKIVKIASKTSASSRQINKKNLTNQMMYQLDELNLNDLLLYSGEIEPLMALVGDENRAAEIMVALSKYGRDIPDISHKLTTVYAAMRESSIKPQNIPSLIGKDFTLQSVDSTVNNLDYIQKIVHSTSHNYKLWIEPLIHQGVLMDALHTQLLLPNVNTNVGKIAESIGDIIKLSKTFRSRSYSYSSDIIASALSTPDIEQYLDKLSTLNETNHTNLLDLLRITSGFYDKTQNHKNTPYASNESVQTLLWLTHNNSTQEHINNLIELGNSIKNSDIDDKDKYYIATLNKANPANFDSITRIFAHLVYSLGFNPSSYAKALEIHDHTALNDDDKFLNWAERVSKLEGRDNIISWAVENPNLAFETLEAVSRVENFYGLKSSDFAQNKHIYNRNGLSQYLPSLSQIEFLTLINNFDIISHSLTKFPEEIRHNILSAIATHPLRTVIAAQIAENKDIYLEVFSENDTKELIEKKIADLINVDDPTLGLRQVQSQLLLNALNQLNLKELPLPEELTSEQYLQLASLLKRYQLNDSKDTFILSTQDSAELGIWLQQLFPGINSFTLERIMTSASYNIRFLYFLSSYHQTFRPLLTDENFDRVSVVHITYDGIYLVLNPENWTKETVSKHVNTGIGLTRTNLGNTLGLSQYQTLQLYKDLNLLQQPVDFDKLNKLAQLHLIQKGAIDVFIKSGTLPAIIDAITIPENQPLSDTLLTNAFTDILNSGNLPAARIYYDVFSSSSYVPSISTRLLPDDFKQYLIDTKDFSVLQEYLFNRTDGWQYFVQNLKGKTNDAALAHILTDEIGGENIDHIWKNYFSTHITDKVLAEIKDSDRREFWRVYRDNAHFRATLNAVDGFDFFMMNLRNRSQEELKAIAHLPFEIIPIPQNLLTEKVNVYTKLRERIINNTIESQDIPTELLHSIFNGALSEDERGRYFAVFVNWVYGLDAPTRLQTPLKLTAWRMYRNSYNSKIITDPNELIQILQSAKNEIDKKLADVASTKLHLPVGYRVSTGPEIELVYNGISRTGLFDLDALIELKRLSNQRQSTGASSRFIIDAQIDELQKHINESFASAQFKYKSQVYNATKLGVGKGNDATHEFANDPVDNYSILVWELSELEKLGFITFDQKVLQWIGGRGMHISIGGETGIINDKNANLLQNTLLSTGYAYTPLNGQGGIQDLLEKIDGDNTKTVKYIDHNNIPVYADLEYHATGGIQSRIQPRIDIFTGKTVSTTEFRVNNLSSLSNLEKTFYSYNRLSIPLMVFQRNEEIVLESDLLSSLEDFIDDPTLFETVSNPEYNDFLLPQIKDPIERTMTILWAYYRVKSIYNFDKYQISGILLSPYNDMSSEFLIALDGELGQIFPTTERDSSRLLDDAFASFHKTPPINSLPYQMQQLVNETIHAVETTFEPDRSTPTLSQVNQYQNKSDMKSVYSANISSSVFNSFLGVTSGIVANNQGMQLGVDIANRIRQIFSDRDLVETPVAPLLPAVYAPALEPFMIRYLPHQNLVDRIPAEERSTNLYNDFFVQDGLLHGTEQTLIARVESGVENAGQLVGELLSLQDQREKLLQQYTEQAIVPYVDSRVITENNVTLHRQDLSVPNPAQDFNQYLRPGYTAYSRTGKLTHQEVKSMIARGVKTVVFATGLDSSTDELENTGSSMIHQIFQEAGDQEVIVLTVNVPGFSLMQMKPDQVNQASVSTDAYRSLIRSLAHEWGLKRETTTLVGHSTGGETVTGLSDITDDIVAIMPALHSDIDPVFTVLSALNGVGNAAARVPALQAIVNPVRRWITSQMLKSAAGKTTETQAAIHDSVQMQVPDASLAKDNELRKKDPLITALPRHLRVFVGTNDRLTPYKAAIKWYRLQLAKEGRSSEEVNNFIKTIKGAGHVSAFTDPSLAHEIAVSIMKP